MPLLEWSSDLDIGIYEIDLQHRSLVSIANQLFHAIESERSARTTVWILDELMVYAKMHFQTEEQYMRRYETTESQSHAKEHESLLKTMRRFKRKLAAEEDVGPQVLTFLSDWLSKHLTGADRALGEAYKARGEGRL